MIFSFKNKCLNKRYLVTVISLLVLASCGEPASRGTAPAISLQAVWDVVVDGGRADTLLALRAPGGQGIVALATAQEIQLLDLDGEIVDRAAAQNADDLRLSVEGDRVHLHWRADAGQPVSAQIGPGGRILTAAQSDAARVETAAALPPGFPEASPRDRGMIAGVTLALGDMRLYAFLPDAAAWAPLEMAGGVSVVAPRAPLAVEGLTDVLGDPSLGAHVLILAEAVEGGARITFVPAAPLLTGSQPTISASLKK